MGRTVIKVAQFSSVTQSCPTPCDPTDSSSPGCSAHGIFEARKLEWVAISSSRRSPLDLRIRLTSPKSPAL